MRARRATAPFLLLTALVVAKCGGELDNGACGTAARCGDQCVELASNNDNCGACGHVCAAPEVCVAAACVACADSQARCGDTCVDVAVDDENCGACGHTCPFPERCAGGTCSAGCTDTQLLCGADGGAPTCVNPSADNLNCGGCGHVCAGGELCVGGACVAPCDSGLTYCSAQGGWSCIDTTLDAANCGACGHDCLGSTCSMGRCAPTLLATSPIDPITSLGLDSTSIYWTTDASPYNEAIVASCAVDGCAQTPTVLASGRPAAFSVISDGTTVYWAERSFPESVQGCATSGCANAPTTYGPDPVTNAQSHAIALDSQSIYWASWTGEIVECSKSGCNQQPATLVTKAAQWLDARAGNLSWLTFDSPAEIGECTTSNCSGNLLAHVWGAHDLGIDSQAAYWVDGQAIEKCSLAGCNEQPVTLTTSSSYPAGLAVDGTDVYWTEPGNNAIMRCSVAGCAQPTFVASASNPHLIAVDAQRVYWSEANERSVASVAK